MSKKNIPRITEFQYVLRNLVFLPSLCILSCTTLGAKTADAANAVDNLRKVEITVDSEKFDPMVVRVSAGETLRFVIHNRDKIAHDFTIGTLAMQKARRSFIQVLNDADELDPDDKTSVVHDLPNAVIVPPGLTKELVWTFKRIESIEFGCNIPLHYEHGMRGKFIFNDSIKTSSIVE